MKAISIAQYGGPEVLQPIELPDPTPEKGQLLVQVRAAGLNFADLMAREGRYPPAPPPPFVPGLEVAGTILEAGADVTGFHSGDRVMGFLSGSGGYAELAALDTTNAIKIPPNLDFAPATALLVQAMSAYFLLKEARLQGGETVLVNAAAGGVGSLAIQLAKLMGAGKVVGTASTPDKLARIRQLGADVAINYTKAGWSKEVKSATGGVNVFLDATGLLDGEGFETLAEGARWMIYGAQNGGHEALAGDRVTRLLWKGITLRGFLLYHVLKDPQRFAAGQQQLLNWATSGQLHLTTDNRFPLAEARRAHEAVAARQTTGKVVLEP